MLKLVAPTHRLLLHSPSGIRKRIVPVFTDGASKSLVIECLLTLNRTKQQTNKHNPSPTLNLTFLFLSCQMQPVDLLGITIKTLAEIEKEVSSQPGTEQVMRAVFTSF